MIEPVHSVDIVRSTMSTCSGRCASHRAQTEATCVAIAIISRFRVSYERPGFGESYIKIAALPVLIRGGHGKITRILMVRPLNTVSRRRRTHLRVTHKMAQDVAHQLCRRAPMQQACNAHCMYGERERDRTHMTRRATERKKGRGRTHARERWKKGRVHKNVYEVNMRIVHPHAHVRTKAHKHLSLNLRLSLPLSSLPLTLASSTGGSRTVELVSSFGSPPSP